MISSLLGGLPRKVPVRKRGGIPSLIHGAERVYIEVLTSYPRKGLNHLEGLRGELCAKRQ